MLYEELVSLIKPKNQLQILVVDQLITVIRDSLYMVLNPKKTHSFNCRLVTLFQRRGLIKVDLTWAYVS